MRCVQPPRSLRLSVRQLQHSPTGIGVSIGMPFWFWFEVQTHGARRPLLLEPTDLLRHGLGQRELLLFVLSLQPLPLLLRAGLVAACRRAATRAPVQSDAFLAVRRYETISLSVSDRRPVQFDTSSATPRHTMAAGCEATIMQQWRCGHRAAWLATPPSLGWGRP